MINVLFEASSVSSSPLPTISTSSAPSVLHQSHCVEKNVLSVPPLRHKQSQLEEELHRADEALAQG